MAKQPTTNVLFGVCKWSFKYNEKSQYNPCIKNKSNRTTTKNLKDKKDY